MQTEQNASPEQGEHTIREHIAEVEGKRSARFLSPEFEIILETGIDELEDVIRSVNGDANGLVIDRLVDQHILDICTEKGIEYIVAPDFQGIIKKPVAIRLIRMA
jgi:DNA primase